MMTQSQVEIMPHWYSKTVRYCQNSSTPSPPSSASPLPLPLSSLSLPLSPPLPLSLAHICIMQSAYSINLGNVSAHSGVTVTVSYVTQLVIEDSKTMLFTLQQFIQNYKIVQ